MENKKFKTVFKPSVARKLLHFGFQIVDIKEHNKIENKTIFIFEETKEFKEVFEKIIAK